MLTDTKPTDANALTPPPDEPLTSNEPYRSNRGRATFLTVALVAYAGVTLISILVTVLGAYLPLGAVIGGEAGEEALSLNDLLMALVGLVTLIAYVASVVLFCFWVHRAYKNLRALGNPDKYLNYSPRWAVGSFFIPLVSLVLPYIIVKEIWDRSDPNVRTQDDLLFQPTGGSPMLLVWWIVWIVSNVLSNISLRLIDDKVPLGAQGMVTNISLISDLANFAAAFLAIAVVQSVTRRQEERSRNVVYTPPTPPPPPVFHQPAPAQPPQPPQP